MMIKKSKYVLIFFLVFCYAKNNELQSIDSQIEKLVEAIHTRDTAYIYQHVFDDVQTGFDADGMGIKSFKERWNVSATDETEWNRLSQIVNSGWELVIEGGDSLIIFPSIKLLCEEEPENVEENFVLFNNTPILNSPNGDTITHSKPILCKFIKSVDQWIYAQFSDGNKGYVHKNNKYNCAYDLRMHLAKDQNIWKIKLLL